MAACFENQQYEQMAVRDAVASKADRTFIKGYFRWQRHALKAMNSCQINQNVRSGLAVTSEQQVEKKMKKKSDRCSVETSRHVLCKDERVGGSR
jgi:hypothetical protein